jgi:hypothetical protein
MTALALGFAAYLAAGTAFACTSFSGRYVYQGEDGRVYANISQEGCARISISWESSLEPDESPVLHVLPLNAQPQADRGWFSASEMQFTSAVLQGNALSFYSSPLSDRAHASRRLFLRLQLLQDGDLCVTDEHTCKVSPPSRASLIRGRGAAAEEAAATRSSERACGGNANERPCKLQ